MFLFHSKNAFMCWVFLIIIIIITFPMLEP